MEIPTISDERLAELEKIVKPLVRKEADSDLWYIQGVDLRNVAFTWSPRYTDKAVILESLRTVKTLHTYGFQGFFKPSIAEVLAQMPADLVGVATAFEVKGPDTVDDLNLENAALNEGFHVALTTFFVAERVTKSGKVKKGLKTAWDRLKEL